MFLTIQSHHQGKNTVHIKDVLYVLRDSQWEQVLIIDYYLAMNKWVQKNR